MIEVYMWIIQTCKMFGADDATALRICLLFAEDAALRGGESAAEGGKP